MHVFVQLFVYLCIYYVGLFFLHISMLHQCIAENAAVSVALKPPAQDPDFYISKWTPQAELLQDEAVKATAAMLLL